MKRDHNSESARQEIILGIRSLERRLSEAKQMCIELKLKNENLEGICFDQANQGQKLLSAIAVYRATLKQSLSLWQFIPTSSLNAHKEYEQVHDAIHKALALPEK